MSKPKLTVLEGGYGRKLHSGYHFVKARATNTRMMGVVGLHVVWRKSAEIEIHELYHLDFESYGIDGYESHVNPDAYYIDHRILKMMGGLGGIFIALEARAVRILLQSAVRKAPECLGEYPEIEEAFPQIVREQFYTDDEYNMLCRQLMPETGLYGSIHYFMMRTIGRDWESRRSLWKSPESNDTFMNLSGVPSTLIREHVDQIEEGIFRITSLVDAVNGYDMIVSEIGLEENEEGPYLIEYAKILKKMKISSIETALMLKKKEYLSVYMVEDEGFEVMLEKAHPELMINDHEAGVLFTRFKDHNRHVENQTFYLSDDILGLYYLTDEDQLILSSFSAKQLEKLDQEMAEWIDEDVLAPAGEFTIDVPILYDFVNSGLGDFYDFLNDEG